MTTQNKQDQTNVAKLAKASASFGANILRNLKDKDSNALFSPHSLFGAIAMATAGAVDQTQQQLINGLSLQNIISNNDWSAFKSLDNEMFKLKQNNVDGKIKYNDVNWVVMEKTLDLNPNYNSTLNDQFNASVYSADFVNNAKKEEDGINETVNKYTNGLIPDLIPPGTLDSLTKLVLLNALYFKGDWCQKFNEQLTSDDDFTTLDGSLTKKPMMCFRRAKNITAQQLDDVTIIDLKYKDTDLVFRIILPNEEGSEAFTHAVNNLPNHLSKQIWNDEDAQVTLTMPKFKMEVQTDVVSVLQNLGVTKAFGGGANFSGMIDRQKDPTTELFISDIIHKAVLEVNEKGSEAAAATAVVMKRCMVSFSEQLNIELNRPFLFAIQDSTTKYNLFLGQYTGK